MHINYDKTNYVYMILGRTNKQSVSQEFDIRIDDKHIKKRRKTINYGSPGGTFLLITYYVPSGLP